MNGTQSHLDYLPEGHTDFVFSTMAEEWGMLGGLALLFGFFLIFKWGLGGGDAEPNAIRAIGRSRADLHDIFLRARQFDDGDGYGTRCGNSATVYEPWRLFDADNHDLYRHHHVDRAPSRIKARAICLTDHKA